MNGTARALALRWLSRTGVYLLLVVLGLLVGAVGAFVQAVVVEVGPVPVPAGLVVSLGGCAGVFLGGAAYLRTRLGAAVPALSWLVVVLVLASHRPEGDIVLPGTPNLHGYAAYAYFFLGALLGALSATIPVSALPAPDHERESEERRVGSRT